MNVDQFNEITGWQKETFPQATTLSKVCHLEQQVEELRTAISYLDPNEVKLEFADCFLLLFGAASAFGMSYSDICQCIDDKMQINRSRTWGKPDANGVVNHLSQ